MEEKNWSFIDNFAGAPADGVSPQKRQAGDEGQFTPSPNVKRARIGHKESTHSLERLIVADDRWSRDDNSHSHQSHSVVDRPPSTPIRRSDSRSRLLRSPPTGSLVFLRQESSCYSSTRTEVSECFNDDDDNNDLENDEYLVELETSTGLPTPTTPIPTVDSMGIREGHVASLAKRIEGWSLTNLRALRRRNNIYASRSASPTCGGLSAMAAAATAANDERRRVLNAKKEIMKAFRKSESSMSVDV